MLALAPEMTSWPGQFKFANSTSASAHTAGRGFVQSDDRRHASFGRFAGFLHETPALAHHVQTILKDITPAAVKAVNSPKDRPAVASDFRLET